jgi:2'-5' RNA ligase
VAIPLEEALRTAMHDAASRIRAAAPSLAWIAPARLHLTLKFLGDTMPAHVEPLKEALAGVARNHRGVPLVLRGAGAFPTLRRPRVVWVGVEPDPRLELLQHDVEAACAQLGFPLDGRAFRPHVTLARAKSPLDTGASRALKKAVEAFDFGDEGTVSSLDLMQSSLTPQGPQYQCLVSATLRAG